MVGRTSSSGTGTLSPSFTTAIYVAEANSTNSRRSSKVFKLYTTRSNNNTNYPPFQTLWLEYVDYWAVQQSQLKAVCEWERATFRDPENQYQKFSQPSSNVIESIEPLCRIFRRLSSYESPVPPPPLSRNQPVLGCVTRECLYNPAAVIDLVKPHLKVILDYAQTYSLMVSEHTAADCSFLELVPTLYRIYENRVTWHALCDSTPSSQKRSRSGTPPTVHCAGAALIEITVKNNKY